MYNMLGTSLHCVTVFVSVIDNMTYSYQHVSPSPRKDLAGAAPQPGNTRLASASASPGPVAAPSQLVAKRMDSCYDPDEQNMIKTLKKKLQSLEWDKTTVQDLQQWIKSVQKYDHCHIMWLVAHLLLLPVLDPPLLSLGSETPFHQVP